MRGKLSGIRYAQVVFEIATEDLNFDEWKSGLGKITGLIGVSEATEFLKDPKVSLENKKGFLKGCLEGVAPGVLNLSYLLVVKDKLKIAPLIEMEYNKLLDEHLGVKRIKVVTAMPLDEAEKENMAKKFENLTGHKIFINFDVDPNIVGGAVIKIKDKLIDGSIKNRLESLKKELVCTRI